MGQAMIPSPSQTTSQEDIQHGDTQQVSLIADHLSFNHNLFEKSRTLSHKEINGLT